MILNKNITAKIGNFIIKDAKVYKDERFKKSDRFQARYYLCHNDPRFDGSKSPDKLGYKYSWEFHENLEENIEYCNNRFTEDVNIYDEDLKEIEFSPKLSVFIEMEKNNLFNLFQIKKGRFEKYNHIDLNDKGFLVLSGSETDRILEMKVGRFLRALADENPKLFIETNYMFGKLQIDNNILEDITNKLNSFNNEEHARFELVSGEDILKGYTRNNYFNDKSSLHGSCMSDKHHFLELYTKNPNIELAIFYFKNKVAARCLVWEFNGTKLYDKIYSNHYWSELSIIRYLKELNIESICTQSNSF